MQSSLTPYLSPPIPNILQHLLQRIWSNKSGWQKNVFGFRIVTQACHLSLCLWKSVSSCNGIKQIIIDSGKGQMIAYYIFYIACDIINVNSLVVPEK